MAVDEMFLSRWNATLTRDADGAPLLPPLFVAEQGAQVPVADVRPREAATGVVGYIPGSAFPGVEGLERLARAGELEFPLVLVSATGSSAGGVAKRLEEHGAQQVAAMAGGLAAWRGLGLSISRDPDGVYGELRVPPETVAGTGPLTLEQVREHLGDPRSVRWIQLASMLAHAHVSCIDGRDARGIIGSPGGDGGEFLLALAAIEKVAGRELDEETVARALLEHLDVFGHFYTHTDAHAFEALIDALRADPRVQPAASGLTSLDDWAEFLRQAPADQREALLEHLVEPAHVGCGHIRLMLQHSEEYGTRRELVVSFLRALYRLWWEGAPELELTVLSGDHAEGAVVNVRLAGEVWDLSPVPLISPSCGGQQIFVNHPDVSAFLRRTNARCFVRTFRSLEPSQESALLEAIDDLAAQQLAATVGHLAKGLPMFDVVFAADGSFEVASA